MFFSLAGFLICFFVLINNSAASINPIPAPSSAEEYLRTAVLINPANGYESMEVPVDVSFCPLKANQCSSRGSWNFRLSNKLISADTAALASLTGLNHFDQLSLSDEHIAITTSRGSFVLPFSGAMPKGGGVAFTNYLKSFEAVLDSRAPGIASVLAKAAHSDRKVNSTQDVATQKNEIADCFALANYVHITSAQLNITEVEQKNTVSGANETHYLVSVFVPLSIQMQSYHFDANTQTFRQHKDWSSVPAQLNPKGKTYNSIPEKPDDVQELFDSAYTAAYKTAALNLSLQIKNDKELFPASKISEVRDGYYTTRQNESSGLRVGSIWQLSREIGGERQQTGLGKAVWVAPPAQDGQDTFSIFQNIKGDAAPGDQLHEIPTSGVKLVFGMAQPGAKLNSIGDSSSSLTSSLAQESLKGVKSGIALNLGYLRNSATLSDIWLTSNLTWAKGSAFRIGGIDMNAPTFFSADIGIEKPFFMGSSGFAISPALGVAYSQFSTTGAGSISASPYSFSFNEVTFKLGVSFDFTFDSTSDVSLEFAYPVQIRSNGMLSNQATSTNYELSNNSFGQAFSASILYRFDFNRI